MKPIYQDIVAIDPTNMTVTVKNSHGQKYHVKVAKDMECHIKGRSVLLGDYAKVTKSPVSKEWVMVGFKINTAIYEDYDCVTNGLEPECTLEDWL